VILSSPPPVTCRGDGSRAGAATSSDEHRTDGGPDATINPRRGRHASENSGAAWLAPVLAGDWRLLTVARWNFQLCFVTSKCVQLCADKEETVCT
jgi:hypothetical protein